MASDEPKYVKLEYTPGESGWAVDLGDGTYEIANVPLSDGLNFGDVVSVRDSGGRLSVDRVVRARYPVKRGVRYRNLESFKTFWNAAGAAGARVEGMIRPRGGAPGLALVNAPEGLDLEKMAVECGVELDKDG